jgi:hypothetical protein
MQNGAAFQRHGKAPLRSKGMFACCGKPAIGPESEPDNIDSSDTPH